MKKRVTITEKYLLSLREIGNWVTVSEWAEKFAEDYPDQLEKSNKQAEGQKQETTGLRELAARISSKVSRDRFNGRVEEDNSERPRKVRYLSDKEKEQHKAQDIKDDIEPINRRQKEREQFNALSTKDKYRMGEFSDIISQLNKFFGTDFELEHASALLNKENPGDHHPDNIQILLKTHNRTKSGKNWERFSLEEQIEYITSAINIQKIIARKMNLDIQDYVLELLIFRLKKIY